MKKTILFVIAILLSINLSAQESITLSLEEAIDYAIENSYSAINASRDIEAAKKKKWETTTIGLPQISATIDYQNWIKQQVSLIPAKFFGGVEGEFTEVAFGTKQNMSATATLNQLIFDGSYLVGLQSAKTYLQISENAKEKTDLGIREAVINAYGNVLLSEESILILEKNVVTLEKNLKETNQIYLNGLTYYRTFKEWKPMVGYTIKIGSKNAKESDVKWQIIDKGVFTVVKITIKPYITSKIPKLLYPFYHYAIIRPKLKSYLKAVLKGLEYYLTHKKPVPRNEFGNHSWFT